MLAWAAFFAFAALVLALRFWLLPDIERYRAEIVARASQAVGLPVKIGGIEAGWLGLRPHISFTDVRIYGPDGRELLALPAVDNVIAWRSLLARELRLHSLVVDGPRLTVRRDAGGALYVAGLKLAQGGGSPRFSEWVLSQDEIEIRNAEIEWRDEKRGAPPLALAEVNLRLRNAGGQLSFGLAARPPAALAESIELRATLAARSITDPSAWVGRLYAVLGSTDLAAWRAWVDYPLDLRQGQGALRLWAVIEDGELREATADVALNGVVASLGAELAPLELATLRGRLNGRAGRDGYELTAHELAATPVNGAALQPTDFRVNWKPAGGTAAESGSIAARLIEFEPLARLLDALPVPAGLRQRVAELEPRGSLTDVKLDWQGAAAAPDHFSLRARLAGVGMRPWEALPGFSGLSGSVEATESRGRLQLHAQNLVVQLTRVFPDPELALDTLTGEVDWEKGGERGFILRLGSVAFANRDAAGTATGTYATSGSGRGQIDLSASLTRADAGRIARYLPHGELMGAKTRQWLASSIQAGQASEVQLRLRGDLQHFPFLDPTTGQFLVTGRFRNGVLDYASGWPRIEAIEGELRFERDRMEITGRGGAIFGAHLAAVRAVIASLTAKDHHLVVSGQAEGPSGDFLGYIEQSPVRRMIGGATAPIAAVGRGTLHLKLDIPLDAPNTTQIAGDFEFGANSVTVHPQLPPIERAGGRLSFTSAGLALHDIRGRLFGGALIVAGGTRPGGAVEIVARGEATVAGLGGLLDDPWRRYLSGASSYVATVNVRDGLVRVGVESSLRGLASALPAPLDKNAGDALPLRLEFLPADGGTRDRVSLVLGRRAQVEILRRRQGEEPAAPMAVQRASVWLAPEPGQSMRLPERPGVLVYGALPTLDLDSWLALVKDARNIGATSALSFDLRLRVLDAYGWRINGAALNGAVDADGWNAAVSANELAGDLTYRAEQGGRLIARLARFTAPAEAPGAVARTASRPREKERALPSIDFVAERFGFRGKDFGHVEILARPSGADWKVEKLAMKNADSTLEASALWRRGPAPLTAIDFTLAASDTGKFLERVGYPGMVKGGNSTLRGDVSWRGEAAALDYASLSGKLELEAKDGQFLEIDPGIGKLISLMNLQALPRRATLDFRDVFSKGFAFDLVNAAAQVERGVMNVEEFRMRGSAAAVEMTGDVDLARETQNLRLRVVPSLGGSTSAVVTLVNPIVGITAAIAQWALKNPLGQIFAYEYAVTGGWAEPKLERLNAPPPPVERVSP
ncbi:MAG TPA: YhdP family protein [Burkholderiales bacterium]